MSRSIVETVLGAIVLIGALFFLVFSYGKGDAGAVTGYKLYAEFSGIGGLKVGDSVQVSGVRVGQVSDISLNDKNYLAKVEIEIDDKVKLPDDTSATISNESLLGGRYLSLQPGASEDFLKNDGKIEFTQAPQNLEELLGKFIFSMKDNKDKPAEAGAPAESPMAP